jgi:7-carboxy-7-deazaguanine synthase (Cx14CxxC type)
MTYSVREIFYTLQGEGSHTGRPAVFCRFSGCNLWSGRKEDRASAVCRFCDTDFVGGDRFATATELAKDIDRHWAASGSRRKFVVLTGGEPLLQVDVDLLDELRRRQFFIAIETNGTIVPPAGIGWICVSPKAGAPLVVRSGNELKVVVPQPALDLSELAQLEFDSFRLQPMDGPNLRENTQWAIEACLRDPRWSLSFQTHKVVGIR